MSSQSEAKYDFIIVGSGAGGGPLASNLAKAGFRVLVLEAGDWDKPEEAQVPAFHALASEHPELSWEFFVKHYANPKARDSKWDDAGDGIFYPRTATVGGCTMHNAMITICGPSGDWDAIAALTGDQSWSGARMRQYFERLEHCDYAAKPRSILDKIMRWFGGPSRHGFDGWLHTTMADLGLVLKDSQLVREILSALVAAQTEGLDRISSLAANFAELRIAPRLDPNDWQTMKNTPEGVFRVPIAVRDGARNGPRELIQQVQKEHPNRLTVQTQTVATEIIFDRQPGAPGDPVAIGVRFLQGKHLYKAHPAPSAEAGTPGEVYCRNEVILCGGAFNTPQLLKLSGIGTQEELDKFGIPLRVSLPGVGANLQDRYEVGITSRVNDDFAVLKGLTLAEPNAPDQEPDSALRQWRETRKGLYATNAVIIGILKKSQPTLPAPDLFIFAVPGYFKGYYRGYSKDSSKRHDLLTWLILKAHTKNRAGTVTLRSANPLDKPEINFHYFYEGTNSAENDDLTAVVEGVRFVRNINEHARKLGVFKEEIWPGPNAPNDASIPDFVTKEAWGHHASCSCPIGADGDKMAVLDSRFRVRGVKNLRVVDASVFPRIPGVFIVANIYMISEKASDVIAEDYPAPKS